MWSLACGPLPPLLAKTTATLLNFLRVIGADVTGHCFVASWNFVRFQHPSPAAINTPQPRRKKLVSEMEDGLGVPGVRKAST